MWCPKLIFPLPFTCNYVVSVKEGFPLPLGAWDGLHYFIVTLPGPSVQLFFLIKSCNSSLITF